MPHYLLLLMVVMVVMVVAVVVAVCYGVWPRRLVVGVCGWLSVFASVGRVGNVAM